MEDIIKEYIGENIKNITFKTKDNVAYTNNENLSTGKIVFKAWIETKNYFIFYLNGNNIHCIPRNNIIGIYVEKYNDKELENNSKK